MPAKHKAATAKEATVTIGERSMFSASHRKGERGRPARIFRRSKRAGCPRSLYADTCRKIQPHPRPTSSPPSSPTVLKGSEQLFASKYRTVLPTEAELIAELERERRVIEEKQNGGDT